MKIKDLKGKFKAIATLNSEWIVENSESIVENIRQQVEKQGGEVYITPQGNLQVKNSTQFWFLPKIERIREGIITFKSKEYEFAYIDSKGNAKVSYGDKPKADHLIPGGFRSYNFKDKETTWILSPLD